MKRQSNETGGVLVTTLVMSAIIGIGLGSYLVWASQHNILMKRSQAWNQAIPVAEAGIEEALAHLNDFPDLSKRANNGWSLQGTNFVKSRKIGSDGTNIIRISNHAQFPDIVAEARVKAPLKPDGFITRTVKVTTIPRPLFPIAIGVRDSVDINGNKILIDSYISTNSSFSTGGRYDPAKRRDNGNVSSNTGLKNVFNIGNANIWGKVAVGPGADVKVGAQGAIGSSSWQLSGKSGVEAGWVTYDANLSFPQVPDAPAKTDGLTPVGGIINGETYNYILTDGTWNISKLSGSIYVAGNAKLIVTDQFSAGNIKLGTNASLNIYNWAKDANLSSVDNPGVPQNFVYWGMPSNESITLSGGFSVTGVVYAPEAEVTFTGGGSQDANFQGAIMAKSLRMNGNVNMHYDEALGSFGQAGYIIVSWNEI